MSIRARHVHLVLLAALAAGSPSCVSASESETARLPAGTQRAKPRSVRARDLRFMVGVWSQPSYSFAKWRARGVNTMISFESLSGTVPFASWRRELERRDLYAIRAPRGDLATDGRDPRLLAWMHPDQPDIAKNDTDPSELAADYRRWKRAAPRVPVFVNLCGPCISGSNHPKQRYQAWMRAADWVSNDFYPVSLGRPDWLDLGASGSPPPRIGMVLDTLADWSRRKPQIQIVESSKQNSDARSVTRAELRGSIWHAVIHGATGVAYFPQSFDGGFKFDSTPPGVAAEMTKTNRLLARLGPVLLSRGGQVGVQRPFEKAVRFYMGRRYEILLNLSHQAARRRGQRFSPYELKIRSSRN